MKAAAPCRKALRDSHPVGSVVSKGRNGHWHFVPHNATYLARFSNQTVFIRVSVVDGHSDTELRLRFHRLLQGACERARLGRAYAVIG
jgi:hypothetical protein